MPPKRVRAQGCNEKDAKKRRQFGTSTRSEAGETAVTGSVEQELAPVLGIAMVHMPKIRATSHTPPRVAIYDVISLISGLDGNHAGKAFRELVQQHPEVHSNGVNFKFPGRGQRETPVADAKGIVEIIMLLPGKRAALTGYPRLRDRRTHFCTHF
jgi:hypothetical protein